MASRISNPYFLSLVGSLARSSQITCLSNLFTIYKKLQILPSVSCIFATNMTTAITTRSRTAAKRKELIIQVPVCCRKMILKAGSRYYRDGGQQRQKERNQITEGKKRGDAFYQQVSGELISSVQQGMSKPPMNLKVHYTH